MSILKVRRSRRPVQALTLKRLFEIQTHRINFVFTKRRSPLKSVALIKPDRFNLVDAGFQPQHPNTPLLRARRQVVEHGFAQAVSPM